MWSVFYSIALILCASYAQISFAAPLTIEINDGQDSVPFEVGDVDQTTSSSFVQIINVVDIRETQLDLGQIIEKSSGIKIRRTGGVGSYSSISIRGKSSDQVMVYVDGMLVNNASGGSVDLSQIPLDQIAKIEIYKDVIPVEFSEASNGGVINIITHRAKDTNSTKLSSTIGSFSTYGFGVTQQAFIDKWQFVFSGGYLTSENDFSFINEAGTPNDKSKHFIDYRNNNQLKQKNLLIKAKHNIDSGRSIQYQAEWFNKKNNIPSIGNFNVTKTNISYENIILTANYQHKNFLFNNLSFGSSISFGHKKTIYDDKQKQIGLVKTHQTLNIMSTAGKVYLSYVKDKIRFSNSTQLRFETLDNIDDLDDQKNRSNSRMTVSNATQVDFFFFNKKLIISPAGRLFLARDNFSGDTLVEGDDLTKMFVTFTSQIGTRYKISESVDIKLNAGRYYRLPNYVELFGTRGYIGSNETLRPEKGINFDAGFESTYYPKSEVITKLIWNSTFFHSIIDDEISYSFDARGVGKPSNNRKSVITGFENNLLLEVFYYFELQSDITFQMPLNESTPNNIKLLSGRPFLMQTTRLSFSRSDLNLYFEHVYESAYYYDTEERLPSTIKSVLNTGIRVSSKDLTFNLSVKNLLDQKNKDYFTQVSPGLSVFLSTNFNFH